LWLPLADLSVVPLLPLAAPMIPKTTKADAVTKTQVRRQSGFFGFVGAGAVWAYAPLCCGAVHAGGADGCCGWTSGAWCWVQALPSQ
jgi:hypothetical protein